MVVVMGKVVAVVAKEQRGREIKNKDGVRACMRWCVIRFTSHYP